MAPDYRTGRERLLHVPPLIVSPYNPEYSWGLGENRGVHGKRALRLLRHKTTNTGAHKINIALITCFDVYSDRNNNRKDKQ